MTRKRFKRLIMATRKVQARATEEFARTVIALGFTYQETLPIVLEHIHSIPSGNQITRIRFSDSQEGADAQ